MPLKSASEVLAFRPGILWPGMKGPRVPPFAKGAKGHAAMGGYMLPLSKW